MIICIFTRVVLLHARAGIRNHGGILTGPDEPVGESQTADTTRNAQCQREGLKAKLEKCSFFQWEVRYLGHVISSEGVAMDPSKTEAVTQWHCPTSGGKVRSFLGFVSYYHWFVEGFTKFTRASLHGPTVVPWSWNYNSREP